MWSVTPKGAPLASIKALIYSFKEDCTSLWYILPQLLLSSSVLLTLCFREPQDDGEDEEEEEEEEEEVKEVHQKVEVPK